MTKKILILTNTLGLGGMERAAQTFAIELQKDKQREVHFGSRDTSGPRKKFLEQNNIPVAQITDENINHYIQTHKIEIVFAHCYSLKAIKNTKVLKIQENVFAGCYDKSADINLPISNILALKMLMQDPTRKLHVLHYPVDISKRENVKVDKNKFLKKHNIAADAHIFGRIARAEPSKRDFAFIQIAKGIFKTDKKAHLLTVGLPFLYRIRLRKYKKRITNIYTTSNEQQLAEVYNALDVFVHTAQRGETFGYVLAEAMLFKKPIIALSTPFLTRNGKIQKHIDNSQAELVKDEQNGYVSQNIKTLIDKTYELLKNPTKSEQLGKKGYEKLKNNYDSKIIINKFIKIIDNKEQSTSEEELTKYKNHAITRGQNTRTYMLHKRVYLLTEYIYLVARKLLRKLQIDIEKKF